MYRCLDQESPRGGTGVKRYGQRAASVALKKFEAARGRSKEIAGGPLTATISLKEKQMGNEGRTRFPNRKAGSPDVSRGQQRRKAQQRDNGENVTVENPSVLNLHRKSPAKGKHKLLPVA